MVKAQTKTTKKTDKKLGVPKVKMPKAVTITAAATPWGVCNITFTKATGALNKGVVSTPWGVCNITFTKATGKAK